MNQSLLAALKKLGSKDAKVKAKTKELHNLTFEEDGSVKGKLIMNVQPSIDENEDIEILKLPEEVTTRWDELKQEKEDNKSKITDCKHR